MNILTYTLQLKDRMSSTLSRIGASTDSTTQDVRELKGEVNSLNNMSLSGFYSSIRKVAATLGAGVIIGKTIRAGMEQEMRNTSFDVLFGGVDNAKRMIDDISTYAANSPYGRQGLSEATQTMAGFGIAQERIMPNLKAIGDIAMGNTQKFQSLTLAFSQMSSTGKLTGQDLLQMINAGFNPLEQISRTTGKSIGVLKEEMAKGAITSDMVTQAFHAATQQGGMYYGMIDKISNTAGGQWAKAMDGIADKMLNLYFNVLQPLILPALKMFNKFLDDPIGTIGRLVDKITSEFPIITGIFLTLTAAVVGYKLAMLSMAGVQIVIAGLKSALVAYEIVVFAVRNATNLWQAAQWLLNAALTANPVGLIIAGIVALIALIAFLVVKIDGWGKTWSNVLQYGKLQLQLFKENAVKEWLIIKNTFLDGVEIIQKGWYKLKSLWDKSAADEGLAALETQRNQRANELAKQTGKVAELQKQIAGMKVIELSWNKTTFSDVADKLKAKIGISTPGVPGTGAPIGDGTGIGGQTGGGASGAGKDTANSIATGGTKTTHITINISELGNDMKIFVSGVKEGAENIRDMILDELTRALAMAQGQA